MTPQLGHRDPRKRHAIDDDPEDPDDAGLPAADSVTGSTVLDRTHRRRTHRNPPCISRKEIQAYGHTTTTKPARHRYPSPKSRNGTCRCRRKGGQPYLTRGTTVMAARC